MTTKLVVVTCVQFADRLLMIQRGPDNEFPYKWSIPGGKVESHESTAEAHWRELGEETDIARTEVEFVSHPGVSVSVPWADGVTLAFDVMYLRAPSLLAVKNEERAACGYGWFTKKEGLALPRIHENPTRWCFGNMPRSKGPCAEQVFLSPYGEVTYPNLCGLRIVRSGQSREPDCVRVAVEGQTTVRSMHKEYFLLSGSAQVEPETKLKVRGRLWGFWYRGTLMHVVEADSKQDAMEFAGRRWPVSTWDRECDVHKVDEIKMEGDSPRLVL